MNLANKKIEYNSQKIESAYKAACMYDINCIKPGNVNNFNINNDFVGQMDGFGFQSSDDSFFVGNNTFIQQFGNELEFTLNSTSSTPGEIPLLGFGALLIYYKKFKKKSYKL